MKLIVGLGNPGFKYKNTRHNIGFLVVKEISKKFRIPLKKRKYNGLSGKGSIIGEKVNLFMPQTYMNLSGDAVRAIVEKNKIDLKDLLILCDDADLKLGFVRLRKKGSSGGHKGLESIITSLGTIEFPRLRIGIGKDRKKHDLAKFVLDKFEASERPILKDIIKDATECLLTWLKDGPDMAMTRFNRRQSA